MSRKQCKRKIYRLVDPIAHAMVGAALVDEKTLDKLRLEELSSIDNMVHGRGTVHDWRVLVDVLNVCEMMGRNGIGPEVLDVCVVAQEELHQAALRYEKTKRMGLTGTGIRAVRELYQWHDLQRQAVPRKTFEDYIIKTHNYIRSNAQQVTHIE
jgi:hypothetical protein